MSLRLKLLFPLLIACLVSAIYIELIWSPSAVEAGKQQYVHDIGMHLDTAIEGLKPLMLANRIDLIQETLSQLQRSNSEWKYIRLTNSQGKWLYPPLIENQEKPPQTSDDIQVIGKEIRHFGKPAGMLMVYVDLGPRVSEIRARQVRLAETLLAIVLMFALTLVITLEVTAVRRLRRLSSATTALARHHFDTPLPQQGHDEIGVLIGSFSSMRNEIKTYREDLLNELEKRRLREQELKHYKAIVESSDDAIIGKTLDGVITSWNPGAEKMFGYTAEEAFGMPFRNLVPQDHYQEETGILARAAQGQREEHFETVRLHKDGRLVEVSASICPIFDESGMPVGISMIARDISDQKRNEAIQKATTLQLEDQLKKISELQIRLQEQVIHDPLTGMFNRRYLDETMPRELALAKREGYLLTVAMLDLDHFKLINDTYGHAAGDEVLRTVSLVLKEKGRESDITCRYGGEEFVVVLPRMSTTMATARVEEWRVMLMNRKIRHGDLEISITMSAGIAGYPEDGSDPDTLMQQVDEALYFSKNQGRNTVTRFQDIQKKDELRATAS